MQKLCIIATIKVSDKEASNGYRVINIETGEHGDFQARRLSQMVQYNNVKIVNADVDVDAELIKINQGREEAYPTFVYQINDFEKGFMPLTVLGKNIDGAYKVANPMGFIDTLSEGKLVKIAATKGLTNAKVVNGKIVAKKGTVSDIIGFNYNYTEKEFSTPNNQGYVQKWKVRLIKNGEPYGREGSLINDKATKVEFISMDTGQSVSRYYLHTLLEDYPSNRGLNLYGDVPSWTIDNAGYKKIRDWLAKEK